MKNLIERLIYRSKNASYGQAIVDEADLDGAIAAIQALCRYHEAYSDRRFAPEGSLEAGDASRRLEDVHQEVAGLAKVDATEEAA